MGEQYLTYLFPQCAKSKKKNIHTSKVDDSFIIGDLVKTKVTTGLWCCMTDFLWGCSVTVVLDRRIAHDSIIHSSSKLCVWVNCVCTEMKIHFLPFIFFKGFSLPTHYYSAGFSLSKHIIWRQEMCLCIFYERVEIS